MFCPDCGQKNLDAANFCKKCGQSLGHIQNSSAGQINHVSKITRQGIYQCTSCGHEGPARKFSLHPWRWWHYLTIFLVFPFGLLYTYSHTGIHNQCAKCNSTKIKRVRYENLPKPEAPTDHDTIRNSFHRKTAGVLIIILLILGIIGAVTEETYTPENESTSITNSSLTEIQIADYNEGYNSGYADGRGVTSKFGDNYVAPATVERRGEYALGYLDGFVKGCNEGNFDCTEAEQLLERISNGEEPPETLLQ